jgi:hypothetical protein
MRKPFAAVATTCLLGLAVPASAHHMAEGFVSDDVYAMIEEQLQDADSPHLDLDLSFIVMGSAQVLTTTLVVDMAELSEMGLVDDPGDIADWILGELSYAANNASDETAASRASEDNSDVPNANLSVDYYCDPVDDPLTGVCTFIITERFGSAERVEAGASEHWSTE